MNEHWARATHPSVLQGREPSEPAVHRGADHRAGDVRVEPHLGTVVHVVGSRQARPNLPQTGCPFCVGGVEAPEPYDVRWFPNRWPAMPGDRCEVVLYTQQHEATLQSLGVAGVRRVIDLWADRSVALGARDDVDFVLVFENRGPEVGATITHPHGQIYAYDHVPERPARLLESGWRPEPDPGERSITNIGGWRSYVPYASSWPIAISLVPDAPVPDLDHLDDTGRDGMAAILVDTMTRLDALYDARLPYMMCVLQRPQTAGATTDYPDAWLNVEIVSPWRGAGVYRFIAAAEVFCGEYFNPILPEFLAERLKATRPS